MNVADIVEREFVDGVTREAEEAEVGEQVSLAREAARDLPGTAAPQQPFPGQQNLWRHGTPLMASAC